jgi:hypothetical protein
MFDKRVKKRIKIIVIYIVVFIIFSMTWGYLFSVTATCTDGIKNQNEKETDCGGPCSPCKTVEAEKTNDLLVLEKNIVFGGADSYDIAILVNNKNTDLGLNNFYYEVSLKDASGNEVGKYNSSSYILPAEKKYLVAMGLRTNGNAVPVSLDVKLGAQNWEKLSSTLERPQLNIYSVNYSQISGGSELYAIVRNEGIYDLNKINVVVILRDSQNKIIAVSYTEKNTVKAKEERDFRLIWPYPLGEDAPNIKVDAYTNILDPQNLLRL